MNQLRPAGPAVYVDAHVHFYPCFPLSRFLEGAAANFPTSGEGAGDRASSPPPTRVMVLLDGREGCPFHELRRRVGGLMTEDGLAYWFRHPSTDDPEARPEPSDFLVVGGRQIPTEEGLEVLAIPSLDAFPHRRSLRDTTHQVLDSGAVPVLPWGLGKWWFRRRGIVLALLDSPLGGRILLGDNGNRPRDLPASKILLEGERQGIPVLPGSDPLPLKGHAGRAGSFGFILDGPLDAERPGEDLGRRILRLSSSPPTFGTRTSAVATLRSNLELRARSLLPLAGQGVSSIPPGTARMQEGTPAPTNSCPSVTAGSGGCG